MVTYNDGHRVVQNTEPPTEPESSSSRAARISNFLEARSPTPPLQSHSQLPLPNVPLSLLINFLPSEQAGLLPLDGTVSTNRGLPPSFLDTLDRVEKKSLKKDDICPICATPYLEDQYPLVVKLQCGHKFDLECIGIWFKEHSSCPMCRQGVEKRKPVIVPDDEEEYDDTYS